MCIFNELFFSTILSKSELVGAETTVVRSKIPTQVGLSGTIVLETKQTLQIVTPKNQLKSMLMLHFNNVMLYLFFSYC